MTILDVRQVVTRKPHRCWGCGRRFPPGSSLQRVTDVEHGQFSRLYWCDVCREILAKYHHGDGFEMGDLKDEDPDWEAIRERLEGKTP